MPNAKLSLALLALLLALVGCSKTNDVTATNSLDCGEDAIRCVPCETGEVDCDGATLLTCKADGRGFTVAAECESAQLCAEGLVFGECAPPVCVAGEVQCVGAVMQLCAPGRHRYDLIACQSEDACLRGIEMGACASVECSASTDCTGEDTQCRRRRCVAGRCEVENLAGDTACVINEVNGVCDGAGACRPTEECTLASDCPGQDTECRIRACQGGACFLVDLPEGTSCETTSVTGECNGEGACLPVAQCTIATDCPGQDTQCQIRACADGACLLVPLPQGSVCDVDGIGGACDGQGSCQVEADCSIATDCPGQDTDCRTRACEDGACAFAFMDAGAACSVDGFGGECDGAGSCTITQQCRTDSDCPGVVTECRRPRCSSGRCTTRNLSGSCSLGTATGVCRSGTCECNDTNGWVEFCNGQCVDTLENDTHCGECGNTCDASKNEVCYRTECICPSEWIDRRCNGICRDITSDPNHCGACNNRCPANAFCTGGSVDGCGSNPGTCHCEQGYQVCHNPTNDGSLSNKCVPFPSSTWEEAGCTADSQCPRRFPSP